MNASITLPKSLIESAKKHAVTSNGRTVAQQIEYWAILGRTAEENPDLPITFIKQSLAGSIEVKKGDTSTFKALL